MTKKHNSGGDMTRIFKFLYTVLIASQIAHADFSDDFGDDLENMAYLSARLLDSETTENKTVVPFPLYKMLVLLYETASDIVKDEINNFFPKPIDSRRIARLASSLMEAIDPKSETELYSHLYIFLNENKVPETALDTMEHVLSNQFVKQIKFKPLESSIEQLNQQIFEDHKGTVKGPIENKNLPRTVAFLVATLFLKTPWQNTFSDSSMRFNNNSRKKSFKGDTTIKYFQDETKTILHIPARDNIYLAIKMNHDGSVTTITADDLSAKSAQKIVTLELPEFAIENSIDLIAKLSKLLPITLSEQGFKTFLLSNEESAIIEEFRQHNKLEVTLSGIKAESVTVAQLISRSGNTQLKECIKVDRSFSFLVYIDKTTEKIPLLNGEIWDPQPLEVTYPFLNAMSTPQEPTSRSFFELIKMLFQNREKSRDWGRENCALCPLSALIAFNNVIKINNNHDQVNEFLCNNGFKNELDSNYIDDLMRNNIASVCAQQILKKNIDRTDLNSAIVRLMDLDDEIKSSLQWSLKYFFEKFDLVEVVHTLTPFNEKKIDIVFTLTPDNWREISQLNTVDLNNHLLGKKNESIVTLSHALLGEDDAQFLDFLLRLFTNKIVEIDGNSVTIAKGLITTSEDFLKVIRSAYFILKNKRLLRGLNDEEKIGILGLTSKEAERINDSELENIIFLKNTIRSSPANVLLAPNIINCGDKKFLSSQNIYITLHWRYEFHRFKSQGGALIQSNVQGLYHETDDTITAAIPAYGDLYYIVQVNRNLEDTFAKPIVSFEAGEELAFFISLPDISQPSSPKIVIPFGESDIQIESQICIHHGTLPEAKKLDIKDADRYIYVSLPFAYAIAKKVSSPDGSTSFAILVTGVQVQ